MSRSHFHPHPSPKKLHKGLWHETRLFLSQRLVSVLLWTSPRPPVTALRKPGGWWALRGGRGPRYPLPAEKGMVCPLLCPAPTAPLRLWFLNQVAHQSRPQIPSGYADERSGEGRGLVTSGRCTLNPATARKSFRTPRCCDVQGTDFATQCLQSRLSQPPKTLLSPNHRFSSH